MQLGVAATGFQPPPPTLSKTDSTELTKLNLNSRRPNRFRLDPRYTLVYITFLKYTQMMAPI